MESQKLYRDKEWLTNQYITKDKSILEISKEFDFKQSTLGYWQRKFDLRKTHKWKLTHSAFEDFKIKLGCQKCGYNKNGHVLQFHHERGNHPINKKTYLSENTKYELKKGNVILLCANCHRELHYERGERKLD